MPKSKATTNRLSDADFFGQTVHFVAIERDEGTDTLIFAVAATLVGKTMRLSEGMKQLSDLFDALFNAYEPCRCGEPGCPESSLGMVSYMTSEPDESNRPAVKMHRLVSFEVPQN